MIETKIPIIDLNAELNALDSEIRSALDQVLAEKKFIVGPPVKQFEKVSKGEIQLIVEPEITKDELLKNHKLLSEANDGYIKLFDDFNSRINNKHYKQNVRGDKSILVKRAQIEHLEFARQCIDIILEHAHNAYESLEEVEKTLKDACKAEGVKYDNDFIALGRRIDTKINLLNNHIKIDRV